MKKQLPVIILLVLIGALLGSFFTYTWYINKSNTVEAGPAIARSTVKGPVILGNDFMTRDTVVKAVKKIGPSVVFITTKARGKRQKSGRMNSPFLNKSQGRSFFGPYEQYYGSPKEKRGSGSGIIISSDGLILTNQHVIDHAKNITVKVDTSGNGDEKQIREYEAKVVGEDKLTDVAIIKIEGDNLPAAELGDSDKARVGEWVVAVGNPLGYEHTVTIGVLSAKGRNLPTMFDREYPNLLQTDAAINPGNSGGPLANLDGKVIGMNTIVSASGQGIGFSIPINKIKKIKDQLINKGKVVRAFIGIQMLSMDDAKAEFLRMPKTEGVLVWKVFDETPASDAGLKKGDVIVEVEVEKINTPEEFQKKVRSAEIGTEIILKIWRDKSYKSITIKVGEMPDIQTLRK
ncbi:MAG: trypsin-like peptidase domain-containing protein [Candidatus Eremiobacteraeota bacterium]|nr:trypsin-like peptidase domain-containing protein [Candidatus Eremiobacteraeota bacterium]